MLYPEGLMHKKINIGLALLVITAVAGIFAWIISARAFTPFIGLNVKSIPLKCILDQPSNTSCSNCGTCTLLGSACGAVSQVLVTPLSGVGLNQVMYGAAGPALCLINPTPPNIAPNPAFTPGSQCLGQILFTPAGHILTNFGCSF